MTSGKQAKTDVEEERKTIQKPELVNLNCIKTNQLDVGHFKCVAILPGLGTYNESSDSELSSGSEDEPNGCEDNCNYDLIGRKNEKKKHNHSEE